MVSLCSCELITVWGSPKTAVRRGPPVSLMLFGTGTRAEPCTTGCDDPFEDDRGPKDDGQFSRSALPNFGTWPGWVSTLGSWYQSSLKVDILNLGTMASTEYQKVSESSKLGP